MQGTAWVRSMTAVLTVLGATGARAAAPAPWVSEAQADILASEYVISQERQAYRAPNRGHGFRTHFTERGILVVPRTEPEPSWEWELAWIGYGRGGRSWSVPEATLSVEKNRIAYHRGALSEWYENGPEGLKQGFVLSVPPEELPTRPLPLGRSGEDGLLHVDLELAGSLSPVISEDDQAIDFLTGTGARVLRYAELKVEDARGSEVPAWMEGFAQDGRRGIRLVLDAKDAVFPLTIDPLATSPVWTAESNQASSSFGASVAAAGDVNGDGYTDVIVGAPRYDGGDTDEGRASLYLGSASGLSAAPAWTAEGNRGFALFGYSVGAAGDVNGDGYGDVLVGAPQHLEGFLQVGRVTHYLGSTSGLSTTPAWTVDGQNGGYFGSSVATAGDVNGDGYADVIVGAFAHSNGQTNEGRAFVYLGSASGPSTVAAWTAESDQASAFFGYSVATAGDVNGDGYADVLVGSPYYDNGQTDEGRALVYLGSPSGLASTPSWVSESDQAGAAFGYSVSAGGDVNGDGYADVLIGATGYDHGEAEAGRAYAYLGSASGLAATPAWTADGNQAAAQFGQAVATAGDVNGDGYADVIVGAFSFEDDQADEGRAFVYLGKASGLSLGWSWLAEGNQASAQFGQAVATAGDVNGDGYADVIVGAPYFDNGQTDEGRAFVYLGSASAPASVARWTAESNQLSAAFGFSTGTAGDVNGDGFADVIVGVPFFDNGQTDQGKALVYLGSSSGLSSTPAWMAESTQAGAFFGFSVRTAGDVNGDGFSDVIVGATGFDNGQTDEGRVFVYLGSASGLASSPAWTAESDQASSQFGYPVGTAGDVNGDGFSDVIVGAAYFDNGQTDEGRVFVYLGSTSGLSSSPAWTAESNQASAFFGSSAGTAGDVNGDGYSDVIAGAYVFANGEVNEGRAFVYHGSASGLSSIPSWTAESNQAGAWFGSSVGTAGDVNGDGYADVIVAADLFANGEVSEGRAFVYHGSAAGLASTPSWTAETDQNFARCTSVGTAGDVNGDGYADVIVGSGSFDNDQSDEGRAFAYLGSAFFGLSFSPAWTVESDQSGSLFGTSVGTAGDVNGDGYAEVIVGAYYFANGHAFEGRAYVYEGNGGRGVPLTPQQRSSDGARPIAHLGSSQGPFRLALRGRTPFGRGKVRLESEVKPLGTPFDGLSTVVGSSTDTGVSGSPVQVLADDVAAATPYHWRMRLLYDPTTSPLAPRSRWITVPWGGWNETTLRTGAASPPAGRASGLTLIKVGPAVIAVWQASCLGTDDSHALYEGTLGDFTSHLPVTCSTGGGNSWSFTPLAGNRYFLIVPRNATREGSYGTRSNGSERQPSASACLPQLVAACP